MLSSNNPYSPIFKIEAKQVYTNYLDEHEDPCQLGKLPYWLTQKTSIIPTELVDLGQDDPDTVKEIHNRLET